MNDKGVAWSTRDEIKFYQGLNRQDREGYRQAMPKRKNWGKIDPKELNKAIWDIDADREIPTL